MTTIKGFMILTVLLLSLSAYTISQRLDNNLITLTESMKMISSGSEQFALDLFSKLANEVADANYDFMISPFSIWTLLVLTLEGAKGNTFRELQNALRISSDLTSVREGYSTIQRSLNVNTSTIEVSALQAVFSDSHRPIDSDYSDLLQRFYLTTLVPVNFQDTYNAVTTINNYINNASRGLIDFLVDQEDVLNAQMVLTSTIFFKGQWKFPFNQSLTKEETFYDEHGRATGTVDMMYQKGVFAFTAIAQIDSHVLELPYGKEDRLSMIILLPRRGANLTSVISKIAKYGIANIYAELKKAELEYEDDEIEVLLPRFSTTSDFALNLILERMGIKDLFDSNKADLSKMSKYPLYISHIYHKTRIEVNEEGTVASGVTGGIFANKATPQRFNVNRPFAYIIFEKTSNSLLFCGQVTQPVHQKQ